jgi:hypothetical protein
MRLHQPIFNRSRSANVRTEMNSTPAKDLSSNKSSSPVTRNLQPYATAAARTLASSGSRNDGVEISPTSSLSNETEVSFVTSSSACCCVRRNLLSSFSCTSAHTNGVTIRVQRGADDSTTRRQNPSTASAASQTLESRRTNTRQFQNLVFGEFWSVLHQFIGANPQIFEPLLLQPTQDFFPLLQWQFFQFFDDVGRTHDFNVGRVSDPFKQ